MSDTPETDAALYPMNQVDIVWPEFARRLERERDEAREALTSPKIVMAQHKVITDLLIERNEARKEAQKSKAYKRVLKVTNENLKRERDEARGALMKIEDLFVDGTDVYADREKMGMIARNALEGAK
jgi:glucan phosphorylase